MMIKILVVSNSGQERIINLNNPTIEALSDNDFAKVTKSLRTSKNRMVCIIQDGNRILRWDRSYVSHAKKLNCLSRHIFIKEVNI
ncbi:TPA: pilus assembly protein PilI [Escherichia coli]